MAPCTWVFIRTQEPCGQGTVALACGVVWCGVVWCGVVWCPVLPCRAQLCRVVSAHALRNHADKVLSCLDRGRDTSSYAPENHVFVAKDLFVVRMVLNVVSPTGWYCTGGRVV